MAVAIAAEHCKSPSQVMSEYSIKDMILLALYNKKISSGKAVETIDDVKKRMKKQALLVPVNQ